MNEGVNYNHTCFLEMRTWAKKQGIRLLNFRWHHEICQPKKSAYYTDTNDEDCEKKEVIHCLFCSFIACFCCEYV